MITRSMTARKRRKVCSQQIWQPLNTNKHEFRLLQIYPAKHRTEPLSCILSVASLDDDVDYEALSYTWGNEPATREVTVGSTPWKIRPNLHNALCHFRRKQSARVMFVDALCIDQGNVTEKNNQVPLMGRVFGQAREVQCWLGEAEAGDDIAFRLLGKITRGAFFGCAALKEAGLVHSSDLQALCRMMKKPYWKRAWITQEIALSRRATIHCGTLTLNKDDIPDPLSFIKSINSLQAICNDFRDFGREQDKPDFEIYSSKVFDDVYDALDRDMAAISYILLLQRERVYPVCQLFNIISATSQSATIPHDHVYGILSLCDKEFAKTIVPAYERSPREAFADFTSKWIQHYKSTKILAYAVCLRHNKFGLPTWVPDFSENDFRMSGDRLRFFMSDLEANLDVRLDTRGFLQIRGCYFDHVTSVLPTEIDNVPFGNLPRSRQFANERLGSLNSKAALTHHTVWRKFFGLNPIPDDSVQSYVGGGSLENAYWQLLAFDRLSQGKSSGRDVPYAFWLQEQHIQIMKQWLTGLSKPPPSTCNLEMDQIINDYHKNLSRLKRRHFFTTFHGYIGVADYEAIPVVGDKVFFISTFPETVLLRQNSETRNGNVYRMVSKTHVRGTQKRFAMSGDDYNDPLWDSWKNSHPHRKLATSWETLFLA